MKPLTPTRRNVPALGYHAPGSYGPAHRGGPVAIPGRRPPRPRRTSIHHPLARARGQLILYDRWYKRPNRNSIDRPVAYSWRDGGPCFPRGRSAWLRRRRRAQPWPPFPSPGDRRLVPRSERYGAGGKTWRHINQSARVPPDRRLAPQHHECQQRVRKRHSPALP